MNIHNQFNVTIRDKEQSDCGCQKYHGFPSCIRSCAETNKLSLKRAKNSSIRRSSSQETLVWCEDERGPNTKPRITRIDSYSPGHPTRRKTIQVSAEGSKSSAEKELELVGKPMPTSPLIKQKKEKHAGSNLGGRTEQRIPQNTPVKEFFHGKKSDRHSRPVIAAAELSNFELNVAEILSFNIRPETGVTAADLRHTRGGNKKSRTKTAEHIKDGPSRAADATHKLKRRTHCVVNAWRAVPGKRSNAPAARSTDLPNLRYFRKKPAEARSHEVARSCEQLEGLLTCSGVRGCVGLCIDTQRMMDEMISSGGKLVGQEGCDQGYESNSNAAGDVEELIDLSFAEACRVFMLKSSRDSIEQVFGVKSPGQREAKVKSAKETPLTTKEAPRGALDSNAHNDEFRTRRVKPQPLIRPLTLKLSPRVEKQAYVQRLLRDSNKINIPS